MEAEVGNPTPLSNFLEPAIGFTLTLNYNSLETPLGINGLLLAADNKALVHLTEFHPAQGGGRVAVGELGARGTREDRELLTARDHSFSLIAFLNKRALDHIESVRDKDRRKDVILTLKLKIRILHSKTWIPHICQVNTAEFGAQLEVGLKRSADCLLGYKYERDYHPSRNDQWFVSGDSGPSFLAATDLYKDVPVTIPASEWIHDFAPQFGLGTFLVAELPIPSDVTLRGDFADRLKAAVEASHEMEKLMHQGEWTDVVEKARPVAELLVKSKDLIQTVLVEKQAYSEDAAKALVGAVGSLFEYSSQFVHRFKRKEEQPTPKLNAAKEDAYLIYALSVSLVNLLARKLAKSES